MNSRTYPEVSELVPQSGPMLLLGRVVAHAPDATTCSVEVDQSRPFRDPDGSVPAWVGLEYMAQCVAAHGGLAARARGGRPRPGLFVGSRRLVLHTDAFGPGQILFVTARHRRGEAGLVAFDCEIRAAGGGEPLAEGSINVYTLEAWSDLGERPHDQA